MLTNVPAQSKMTNVTAFVDVTNIAQYTQKQVSQRPPLSSVQSSQAC